MTGKTHMAVGASTAWIGAMAAGAAGVELTTGDAALLVALGALGALLPDLDAPKSRIHNVFKGLTTPIGYIAKHRNFFHSLLAVAIVFGASWWFGANELVPGAAFVLAAGYISHIVIDMLTPAGVRVLFPLKAKLHWLPRKLSPKTGGIVDNLLFLLASGATGLFLISMI
ncbi:MAG: metal-dependent hydrolase [Candidatus Doudnabacteria bacterium]|nr:metal-dependent hydrolase [Candidatus Doudnabacteria bacterium]